PHARRRGSHPGRLRRRDHPGAVLSPRRRRSVFHDGLARGPLLSDAPVGIMIVVTFFVVLILARYNSLKLTRSFTELPRCAADGEPGTAGAAGTALHRPGHHRQGYRLGSAPSAWTLRPRCSCNVAVPCSVSQMTRRGR